MAPCRHCKSPSRFNPCWYGITVDKWAAGRGYDPPCLCDDYAEEVERRERHRFVWGTSVMLVVVTVIVLIWFLT